MTTVELNGKEYQLDWNLFAQLQMERIVKVVPEINETATGQSCMLIWAAIHGGTENFAEDPDWVIRSCGKDMTKFRELNEAALKEIEAFRKYNEKMLEPKKTEAKPMRPRGGKH